MDSGLSAYIKGFRNLSQNLRDNPTVTNYLKPMLKIFGLGYDEGKLKSNLKMAMQRCKIVTNKKTAASKIKKKEVAALLDGKKEEKARIQTEALIREDFTIESLEIIGLHCELLHERVKYISASSTCPSDIAEAVCTIIWVADKIDIPELVTVKSQVFYKLFRLTH